MVLFASGADSAKMLHWSETRSRAFRNVRRDVQTGSHRGVPSDGLPRKKPTTSQRQNASAEAANAVRLRDLQRLAELHRAFVSNELPFPAGAILLDDVEIDLRTPRRSSRVLVLMDGT
jgi:hypothetical protein